MNGVFSAAIVALCGRPIRAPVGVVVGAETYGDADQRDNDDKEGQPCQVVDHPVVSVFVGVWIFAGVALHVRDVGHCQ